jgi:hypothetical protein
MRREPKRYEVEVKWKAREGYVRVRAGLTLVEARQFRRNYRSQGYAARVIEIVRKVKR